MIAAVGAAVGLCALAGVIPRISVNVPALAFILAPWALLAMATVPLKMRDLPEINHQSHEGQRLGWINSVIHGKLLMADAGTTMCRPAITS